MAISTLMRCSKQIKKRNGAACSSMICQMEREGTTNSSSQCKRNNRASSRIGTLPDELVIEILSLLPPKSFFCCKTVCKLWLSLFSIALEFNKHLPTLGGIFYNNSSFGAGFMNLSRGANKVEIDGTISALSSYALLRIIDCCNGLLLIEALSMNTPTVHELFVYNPATRTLLTVWSFTPTFDHEMFYQTFSLAFDPQVHSQFHIICFSSWKNSGGIFSFLDIFSFERGKCTSQKNLACNTMIRFCSKGTSVEGRVYRVTTQHEILSIDPKKCSYVVIHQPNIENNTLVEIGQSQGLLHCLSLCDKKGLLFIWVLKSYNQQEWVLKHRLSLHQIYSGLQPHFDVSHMCYRMRLFGHFAFHPEKDILFMPLRCAHFMSLDLSTGKTKKVGSLSDVLRCWVYMPCYSV